MSESIPRQPADIPPEPYGVEHMSVDQLASKLAEFDAISPFVDYGDEDSGAAFWSNQAKKTALLDECVSFIKCNPDEGRQLFNELVDSENPVARRLAAYNISGLLHVDPQLGMHWFAELLTDPDIEVEEAAASELRDGIDQGWLELGVAADIALRLASTINASGLYNPTSRPPGS
jgi:hypothetical protein